MSPESVERYRGGESLEILAREHAVAIRTMRRFLVDEGLDIRAKGRPPKPNPTPAPIAPPEPRYSCGHTRTRHPQCTQCDRCQCPRGKRKPIRKYSGLWQDLGCGKLIA